jgi:hypothetical protein
MKTKLRQLAAAAMVSAAFNSAPAAIRYVDLNSTSPTPPFTSWATAATNIQDAVDAAMAGDQILVTNGIYANGGAIAVGTTSNRVAVLKPLSLQSVNGPGMTVIKGDAMLRCVYLTNGAVLSGFTLSNAALWSDFAQDPRDAAGGGLLCESATAIASNCVIAGNFADWHGGGAHGGTLIQCTLSGNMANGNGGGASSNIMIRCTVTNNSGGSGGGAYECVLEKCLVTGNSCNDPFAAGGGIWGGTGEECMISSNSVSGDGGGAAGGSRLNRCSLSGNLAGGNGGGTIGCTLISCELRGNQATNDFSGVGFGGGAHLGTLINCTLVGNKARYGGGVMDAWLTNCIVYFNAATYDGANYSIGFPDIYQLHYCCTTPMPANGVGNITNAPFFIDLAAGNFRLQPNSPCIDAGTNVSSMITNDLDGRPRPLDGNADGVAAFDIGAYEYQPGVRSEFIGWLSEFGLCTDGSADYADADNDGMNNWQEWIAGTVPTNASSALRLLPPSIGASGILLTWQSVTNRTYSLECSTNLATQSAFSSVASNIVGQAGTTTYTDSTKAGSSFYRVRVERVE